MQKAILYSVLSKNPLGVEHRRNLLLLELSKLRPVIFLSDVREKSFIPNIYKAYSNVSVVNNALRLSYSRLYGKCPLICSTLDTVLLNRMLAGSGFNDYVPWITTPEPQIRDVFSHRRYIYDCIDPCFIPHFQTHHDSVESELIRGAVFTMCTATALFEKSAMHTQHRYLVNNAVDSRYIQKFSELDDSKSNKCSSTLVYLGTVDWRVDFKFLRKVASTGHNLIIAGRANPEHVVELDSLAAFTNVKVLGSVSDDIGIELLRNSDVALLPYVPGHMNDCINSLKMYLYMAAGLPILSTSINESRLNELVTVSDYDCSVEGLGKLIWDLSKGADKFRIKQFAARNTWDTRALQVNQLLRKYEL